MTSEQDSKKSENKNEWEKFVDTGKGGKPAVKRNLVPRNYNISSKQRRALKRSPNV